MKKTLLCAFGVLLGASGFAQITVYDSFTGISAPSAIAIGGSTVVGDNTITALAADDVTMTNLGSGMQIVSMTFAVANLGALPVTARPLVRMWFSDGAGGGPGTYYNNPAAVNYAFSPVSFSAGNATFLAAAIPTGFMTIPSGTIWVGLQFDNNHGATGATGADLDTLGVVFNDPTIGSSADNMFVSDVPASDLFNVPNPSGTLFNLGGAPPANLVWKFEAQTPVPEPASMIALGMGAFALLARRRRRKTA